MDCSLEELHALVQKDPWEEIWKVYLKQLTNESCELLQGRFALINGQLFNVSTPLSASFQAGSPGPTVRGHSES